MEIIKNLIKECTIEEAKLKAIEESKRMFEQIGSVYSKPVTVSCINGEENSSMKLFDSKSKDKTLQIKDG